MKRAILIPTDGPAREVDIPDHEGRVELDELQRLVGGWIQYVPTEYDDVLTLYCNEEGKLDGLPPNWKAARMFSGLLMPGDVLVGDVVVLGRIDEEGYNESLDDVPTWLSRINEEV